jgi:small subunit ribosomal protein S6
MMNIECDQKALDELNNAFRFNDAVLRKLIIKRKAAITEPSSMMKDDRERNDRGDRGDRKREPRERTERG